MIHKIVPEQDSRSISILTTNPRFQNKNGNYAEISLETPQEHGIDEGWNLRPFQEDIIDQWCSNKSLMCIAPTGSGKSLTMVTMAAINFHVNRKSTYILVPKITIAQGFSHTDGDHVFRTTSFPAAVLQPGEIRRSIPEELGDGSVSESVEETLERSDRLPFIQVCCYRSFDLAYRRQREHIDPSKIDVFIDEAHHIMADDHSSNALGKLVKLLEEDGVTVSKFTATGYRADGGVITNGNDHQYRRTLCLHHQEQFCPDLNIKFRFFDDVQADDYTDTTGQDSIQIDCPDKLVDAYVGEYLKDPGRHVLMYIPQRIGDHSAAVVACNLEKALKKANKHINVINFGGYDDMVEDVQLTSKMTGEYRRLRGEFEKNKSNGKINVVISIKIMDEGVDWPDCDAVYMARVPQSLPLIVQRIGRAMRRKKNRKQNVSDVFFFELNVKSADSRITRPMVHIACRLRCLFHGLEFSEPFHFKLGGRKKQQLLDKLNGADASGLNKANLELQKKAMQFDGSPEARIILAEVMREYLELGVELTPLEALEVAVGQGLITTTKTQEKAMERALKGFLSRVGTKSQSFQEFCNDASVKAILDELVVQGPREYLRILSGYKAEKLDSAIREWVEREHSSTITKQKLIKMAKNGEKKPRITLVNEGERRLGWKLNAYMKQYSDSYDKDFSDYITQLRPDWFVDAVAIKKNELLEMAKAGKNRPNCYYKSSVGGSLDAVLRNYTDENNRSYDQIFTDNIKKLRPDWFIKSSDIKKEKLLKMAESGVDRPISTSENGEERILGLALIKYIRPASDVYDQTFTDNIKKLRPDWFKDNVKSNKEKLLEMARMGHKRPSSMSNNLEERNLGSALTCYLSDRRQQYDKTFYDAIKSIRLDWIDKSLYNKMRLIELASGQHNKPNQHSHDDLERRLAVAFSKYVNVKTAQFDSEFEKQIRELRPDWFSRTHSIKSTILDIARSGAIRPNEVHVDTEIGKLGRAIGNYTNKGSSSYDPVFSEQIRSLRPDWFKK
jgi:hypothetical protein